MFQSAIRNNPWPESAMIPALLFPKPHLQVQNLKHLKFQNNSLQKKNKKVLLALSYC